MSDIHETINEQIESANEGQLNMWVALLVAITATFMALSNVKDGNITQAMAQAQAEMLDHWSYYQAKSTKENIAQAQLDQLTIQKQMGLATNPQALAALEAKIQEYAAAVAKYKSEKEEIKQKAEGFKAEYDRLNYRDDQFDLAEAGLSLAIALFGVSALTQKRWLFIGATLVSAFGTLFAIAGFFGLRLHSDLFAKLLG
jgi:DNA repair ATPase RecN